MKKRFIIIILCFCYFNSLYMNFSQKKERERMEEQLEKNKNELICLSKDFSIYSEMLLKIEKQLEFSKEECENWKNQYKGLETKYNTNVLVGNISDELDKKENGYSYIEKYLRLQEGELADAINSKNPLEWASEGMLGGHFSAPILPVGEDIYVQYRLHNTIARKDLPRELIIYNSYTDIGFMGARAGMNFNQIQENAYKAEIKESFMFFSEVPIYYIEYKDDRYSYFYMSTNKEGENSELHIQ